MEDVAYLREIRQIYNEYLAEVSHTEEKLKKTDGLLGFGKGIGSAPCHDHFSERLEQALADIGARAPSPLETGAVLWYIYDAPLAQKENTTVYWMLLAVHALTENLIPLLSPEEAAGLYAQYSEAYPRSVRLPAQNKIASLLQAQSGEYAAHRKHGLLERLIKRGG